MDTLTIQSGGELNAAFLRAGLIDRVSLVLAPLLVGGRTTPTLIDGEPIRSVEQLGELSPLRLVNCRQMQDSFIHLEYEVLPAEVVEG